MGTEATTTTVSRAAPAALCLQARAWSRASKVLDLDAPSPTAPLLRSSVGVPFLWEEAPGRPKAVVPPTQDVAGRAPPPSAPAAAEGTPVSHGGEAGGGDRGDRARACPVAPLKLPPRLQAAAAADSSLSPKTVLHGPYGGGGGGNKPPRPLRRSGSTASHRRKPGAGVSLWRKATAAAIGKKHGQDHHDAAALDASCRSPSSSSSSSSSSSLSYFGDDHRRQADGHEDPEDDGEEGGAKSTVRITRFRRNKSLASVTTSHLWASIRRSVKQITPWS